MRELCFLNGRILPLAEAAISPLDRGFVFGDAIYETVKLWRGVPLFLARHLERLASNLRAVAIPQPPELEAAIHELLAASALDCGSIYLQISRGVAPRRHLPAGDLEPTVFLLPSEIPFPEVADGTPPLVAATLSDLRWQRCDLKTTSLIATILGKLEAAEGEAEEILFTGPEGEIREGGNTNFFARRGEVLETHPLGPHILSGITRGLVLDLAREEGLAVAERAPLLAERSHWSEAFACGTLTGMRAVCRLDGEPIGNGSVGPWTRRLAAGLRAVEETEAAAWRTVR